MTNAKASTSCPTASAGIITSDVTLRSTVNDCEINLLCQEDQPNPQRFDGNHRYPLAFERKSDISGGCSMRALSKHFGVAGLAVAMAVAPAMAQTSGGTSSGGS